MPATLINIALVCDVAACPTRFSVDGDMPAGAFEELRDIDRFAAVVGWRWVTVEGRRLAFCPEHEPIARSIARTCGVSLIGPA